MTDKQKLGRKITRTGQTYWYLNGKRITPSEAAYYRHRVGLVAEDMQ